MKLRIRARIPLFFQNSIICEESQSAEVLWDVSYFLDNISKLHNKVSSLASWDRVHFHQADFQALFELYLHSLHSLYEQTSHCNLRCNTRYYRCLILNLQVLARSSPTDKFTLVKLLKQTGEVVAVTGDGEKIFILLPLLKPS